MICIIFVTYPLILHIVEVGGLKLHYLHYYWRFSVFDPTWASFCPFFDLYEALEPNNYLRSAWFVLFLLPTHVYYILVKLDDFNGIICIIIEDFVFLTPLQLHFDQFVIKNSLKMIFFSLKRITWHAQRYLFTYLSYLEIWATS